LFSGGVEVDVAVAVEVEEAERPLDDAPRVC